MGEINLPPNADQIHPNDCTCGVVGCHEHQTWGDWLLDQIFGEKPETTLAELGKELGVSDEAISAMLRKSPPKGEK